MAEQRRIARIDLDEQVVDARAEPERDDVFDHAHVVVRRAGAKHDIADHITGGPHVPGRNLERQRILKIGALFSPMRLFLPISGVIFLSGLGYYGYTYIAEHRFTNMSTVLLLSSLFTFLIGILSEQISSLHYLHAENDRRKTVREEGVAR